MSRSGNGFGANPLTYTEILSYFTLMSMFPEEWELDLIKLLDKVALDEYSKETEKKMKQSSSDK